MNNHKSRSVLEIGRFRRKSEAGMALIVVLLLLLLVSAIGLGMVYMSNTETSINSNYRDSQLAFYAMRGGLEEVHDRMRTTSPWPIALPAVLPGNPNSILYMTNPAAGEVVNPQTVGTAYFDDEFCHEYFNLGLANPGTGVPCAVGPPAGSVVAAYVNSISPNTTTASALKYKWARITMKENGTFANGVSASYVDPTQPATTQVCYQSLAGQEIPVTLVPGGPFASCAAAVQAGQDASPVYVVTSLAVTPNGSRRMGQYEMASVNIGAPPSALGMDGPAAVFNPTPSSSNYFINGTDSGAAGFTGPASGNAGTGTCNPTGATVPAISTGDSTGVTNITNNLVGPPNLTGQYTGSGGTPSIVNAGSGGTRAFSGEWSTPAQLDNMVNALAAVANNTYSGCGINGVGGSACTPGAIGSAGNPQITYVNGDFNYGNSTAGEGVLIVTGTLSFTGNAAFNGLILIIGQGAIVESGGGNGGFNGSVFMAKTHSSVSPFPELTTLGTPTIAWNGGGKSFIQYNSCWANVLNGSAYTVVAGREEMY
jgi:PilX N-terminal